MNEDFFSKPLLTTQSRMSLSPNTKQKTIKRKSGQQNKFIDKILSKPTNQFVSNSNRHILPISRKFQMERSNNKFQNTLSNFESPKYKQDRMCETMSNGFTLNQRPISKQQSRTRIGDTGILNNNNEGLIINQFVDLENQNMNQNKFINNTVSTKIKRPQTSKGQRNKCIKNKKQQVDIYLFSPQKIKKTHPNSAFQRNRGSIILDDIIKINTKPSTNKLKKAGTLPFTSLIDNDFLSLFASHD